MCRPHRWNRQTQKCVNRCPFPRTALLGFGHHFYLYIFANKNMVSKNNSPYTAAITGCGFMAEEMKAILPLLLSPDADALPNHTNRILVPSNRFAPLFNGCHTMKRTFSVLGQKWKIRMPYLYYMAFFFTKTQYKKYNIYLQWRNMRKIFLAVCRWAAKIEKFCKV